MQIGPEESRRPLKAEAPFFFSKIEALLTSPVLKKHSQKKDHQRIDALAVFSSMADTPEAFQTPSRDFLSVGVEIYTALTPQLTNLGTDHSPI